MMEAQKGKRVMIRFQCKLQDGTVCHVGESETQKFVLGTGTMAPSFEEGIMGMRLGERRQIRVPAEEVRSLSFAKAVESETPPGISYEFGPGDGGDVDEYIPPRPRHPRPVIPAGADLFFDVELVGVEEPSVK